LTSTVAPRIAALMLLTTALFLMLYQTNTAQSIVRSLLFVLPPFLGRTEVIFSIMFGLFASTIGGIYTIGGKSKVTLLTVYCFPFLLFIAMPFSLNNWNSNQTNPYLNGGLPFFFVVASSIVVFSCLISLNLISKLEYTEKELNARGALKKELKTLISKSLIHFLPVTVLSAILAIGAYVIVMIAKPLGTIVVGLSPSMTLIIGIASIAAITLLIYYTPKQL
jgi:hypothetical protein